MAPSQRPRGANVRLALVLASIALVFFVGIVVKFTFFPS
jgi:hypothetical protein